MKTITNISDVTDGEGTVFYSNPAVTRVRNLVKVTPYHYDLSCCRPCEACGCCRGYAWLILCVCCL